jgi:Helix-turn-helix
LDPLHPTAEENVEVLPLVVVAQTFPARPSSIPDIRDFVNRCLAQSPLSDEDRRAVTQTVSEALLEAAGPTGTIQVSFRIFPDHAEVDVLRSHSGRDPGEPFAGLLGSDGQRPLPGGVPGPVAGSGGSGTATAPYAAAPGPVPNPAPSPGPGVSADAGHDPAGTSFADWMAGALRREGMTMEVAARQLGVSVKTVSRWVGGATEPRLRDLRRIRELFGDFPFP